MNKFRFSMLFAAALTIVSVALPMSAASIHNSNHGQVLAAPRPTILFRSCRRLLPRTPYPADASSPAERRHSLNPARILAPWLQPGAGR